MSISQGISLYYLATFTIMYIFINYVIYTIAYCYIVQITLYLYCRSLVNLLGHVRGHMTIETSSETSFER